MTSPVQNTNIERILEDHLWDEVAAIEARISDLQAEIDALDKRREKLEDIANAAGIERP